MIKEEAAKLKSLFDIFFKDDQNSVVFLSKAKEIIDTFIVEPKVNVSLTRDAIFPKTDAISTKTYAKPKGRDIFKKDVVTCKEDVWYFQK